MEKIELNGQYLLLLGAHPVLSRAEVRPFCDEVRYYQRWNFLVAENLWIPKLRTLPKHPAQQFLDRFGGIVRIAKIVGEFDERMIAGKAAEELQKRNKDGVVNIGMSSFGLGRNDHQRIRDGIVHDLKTLWERKVRVVREASPVLSSGRIFNDKLLKKGGEVIVFKTHEGYMLAVTEATQNLRNYTLRDHKKPFRDAKMGMLPPKIAQMLLNFANPKSDDIVVDSFCGSGTINSEAAIMGYKTQGGDVNGENVNGARENFEFLSEKFRFDSGCGDFETKNAIDFDYSHQGVLVTEGYLGVNFETRPNRHDAEKSHHEVVKLWENLFENLKNSHIHTVAFCLPAIYQGEQVRSIREKIFAKAKENAYTPVALFGHQTSYVYSREGAFVGREICVVKRNA